MTICLSDLRIFVISLPGADARRRLMSAQLDVPQMPPFDFIDAVDGLCLTIEQKNALYDEQAATRYNRPLTLPEVGCAASHQCAYERMINDNLSAAIILEDDALLGHQFPQVLARVLTQTNADAPAAILFSHVGRYTVWGGRTLDRLHRLYRPHTAYGAHAYLITLAGAKSLLAALRPIYTVADDWQRFAKMRLIDIRAVVPYPVGTAPAARSSQIGNERFAVLPTRGKTHWLRRYLWQKFLFQIFVKPLLRLRKQVSSW